MLLIEMLTRCAASIDDIEDNSEVRRGVPGERLALARGPLLTLNAPAAHKVFGVAQTLNSANYVYFLAFQKLAKIKNVRRGVVVEQCIIGRSRIALRCKQYADTRTDEAVNLHRGQGLELYWREHYVCPTEEEYIDMVNNSASFSARLAVILGSTSCCRDKRTLPHSSAAFACMLRPDGPRVSGVAFAGV